jgi:hypothetical protein
MSRFLRRFLRNFGNGLIVVGGALALLALLVFAIHLTVLLGPVMLPLIPLICIGLGAALLTYLEAE